MSGPWVSVDDVARRIGVAKDTIYRGIEAWKRKASMETVA